MDQSTESLPEDKIISYSDDGSTLVVFAMKKKRLGLAVCLYNSGAAMPTGKLPRTGGKNALHLLFTADLHSATVKPRTNKIDAISDWVGLLKKFIAAGVSMAEQDDKGNTPLHVAVSMPQLSTRILKVLAGLNLPAGVVDIKNNAQETALDIVCERNYQDFTNGTHNILTDTPLTLLNEFVARFSPGMSAVDANGETVLERAMFPNDDRKQAVFPCAEDEGEHSAVHISDNLPGYHDGVVTVLLGAGAAKTLNLLELFKRAMSTRNEVAMLVLAQKGACAGANWRKLVLHDVLNGGEMIGALKACCNNKAVRDMLGTWYTMERGGKDSSHGDMLPQDAKDPSKEDQDSESADKEDDDNKETIAMKDKDDGDDDWEVLSPQGVEDLQDYDLVDLKHDMDQMQICDDDYVNMVKDTAMGDGAGATCQSM